MTSVTHIYLVENCYGDPNKVYIGKTKNSRENDHKRKFGKQIIYNFIDQVNSLDKKDWEPLEKYWIQQFKAWGFDVVNKNNGGGGSEYCSEETKQKIRLSNQGKPKPEGFRKGIIFSEEQKKKIGDALRGKKRSEETIKKLKQPKVNKENFGKKRRGTKFSEVWIEKMRKSPNRLKPVLQFDLQGNLINEFIGVREASRQTGVYDSAITLCCKGYLKKTKGFIFKYKKL